MEIYNPDPYQVTATDHIVSHPAVEICNGAGMFLDMGMGKTVSTLTAFVELRRLKKIKKMFVIAPKRVAEQTWPAEVEKWAHTASLKVSVCIGSATERRTALRAKADIYTINRENTKWLVNELGAELEDGWLFVIDESSSFKNPQSERFRAIRTLRPLMTRVVILTGTPMPNTYLDLWPQLYLCDKGHRLGKKFTDYRKKYFNAGQRNGHVVFDYSLKKGDKDFLGADIYEREIFDKISDICISMKAEDYVKLPERIDRFYNVELDKEKRAAYDKLEAEMVLEFEEEEITAVNAVSLQNKLRQIANGAVYTDPLDKSKFLEVHNAKIEALEEILEAAEGKPVLCFYNFKHDVKRICKHLAHYKPYVLSKHTKQDIDAWNAGKIKFLLAHPASAGHGLNMQDGGNLAVWFGVPWDLEGYQQANKRLHRRGQKNRVVIQHIMVPGTIDDDIMAGLNRKDMSQERLMSAVKAIVRKHNA